MGRNQMLERLTEQMRTQSSPPKDPRAAAVAVLQARGHLLSGTEKFSTAGIARNKMTAEERAKDRASRRTGLPVETFGYDPQTNRATRKG